MGKTWILVAHRSGARLFENRGPGKGLELLQDVNFSAGKLKSRDIDSDKAGRSFDRRGSGRHAYSTEQAPIQRIAEQFAKQLCNLPDNARRRQRYSELVPVADPRFLGNLRASLTPQTTAMVRATLDKDLGPIEERDLLRHLGHVVRL